MPLKWVTLLGTIRNTKRHWTEYLPSSHQHDCALRNSSYVSIIWLSEQWKQWNSTWTFQLQSDEGILFSCRHNYSQLLYILKYQQSNQTPQTPLGRHSRDVGLLFLQPFGSIESLSCFSTQYLWKVLLHTATCDCHMPSYGGLQMLSAPPHQLLKPIKLN